MGRPWAPQISGPAHGRRPASTGPYTCYASLRLQAVLTLSRSASTTASGQLRVNEAQELSGCPRVTGVSALFKTAAQPDQVARCRELGQHPSTSTSWLGQGVNKTGGSPECGNPDTGLQQAQPQSSRRRCQTSPTAIRRLCRHLVQLICRRFSAGRRGPDCAGSWPQRRSDHRARVDFRWPSSAAVVRSRESSNLQPGSRLRGRNPRQRLDSSSGSPAR